MKSIEEQDHYEVLEVPRTARAAEIERAFRTARVAYADDSLALYSVFESAETTAIRERVETAYRVLSDTDARREYDELVFGHSELEPKPEPAVATEYSPSAEVYAEMEAEVEEEGQTFDGPSLRRARLRRGIELKQISDITKVSRSCLGYLEDEKFGDLPASVYVRGFVTAYARAIGLDPKRVASVYMARVEEARGKKGRGRFPGRK
jgi:curved DNA-binding protein CbpA